jgi:hypothetical protein
VVAQTQAAQATQMLVSPHGIPGSQISGATMMPSPQFGVAVGVGVGVRVGVTLGVGVAV